VAVRVGIDYTLLEHAAVSWRFVVARSLWISAQKKHSQAGVKNGFVGRRMAEIYINFTERLDICSVIWYK
jgi:hypothetical protein